MYRVHRMILVTMLSMLLTFGSASTSGPREAKFERLLEDHKYKEAYRHSSEESSHGKGKGSKGSHSSTHSSWDYDMSMSMSMPGYMKKLKKASKGNKGSKGSKGSKESKESKESKGSSSSSSSGRYSSSSSGRYSSSSSSSKSSKSGKSGKSSKTGKSGKSSKIAKDKPTQPSQPSQPSQPTTPPSPTTPATPSPTSETSIPVRATPFALFYDGDFPRIPTDGEFAALADVTRLFLEEKIVEEFEQTSLTNLDDFVTFMIRNAFEFGAPVQADHRSTGLFNPSSIFLPTVRELNQLIDAAFQNDNLEEYISRVRALPSGNIFRSTQGVAKGLPSVPVPRNAGSANGSGTLRMGLAAAAAGIVVLAAGVAMLKRHRGKGDTLEDPYSENLKGDTSTFAIETCNTSLDEASAAWRKTSPYATSLDMDESEFEDEPLDSDEDGKDKDVVPLRQGRQRGVPPTSAFTT